MWTIHLHKQDTTVIVAHFRLVREKGSIVVVKCPLINYFSNVAHIKTSWLSHFKEMMVSLKAIKVKLMENILFQYPRGCNRSELFFIIILQHPRVFDALIFMIIIWFILIWVFYGNFPHYLYRKLTLTRCWRITLMWNFS